MSIPHLLRRPRRRPCFRIVVPPELRPEFGNRREVREVVPDGQDPRTFCCERYAHWRKAFAKARGGVVAKAPVRASLLPAEVDALARRAYVAVLRDDEEWRATEDEDELARLAIGNDEALEMVGEGTPAGREFVEEQAEGALSAHGVALDRRSPAWYTLLRAVRLEVMQALRDAMRRDSGVALPTPVESPPVAGLLLSEVVSRWAAERKPAAKTRLEARTVLARFKELHGDIPVAGVTKAHAVALKDKLVTLGRAPGTIKKQVRLLGAWVQFAVDNDYIRTNPVAGVKVPRIVEKTTRRAFRPDELAALFAHPIYAKGERTGRNAGEALYWLPLLALYSGARLTELAQLGVADVREYEGRGWYFEIHEREEGMRLKTASSRREVPIHAELVRLGFLTYVAKMRDKGERWVFPKIGTRADGGRNVDPLSKAFARVMHEAGLSDPALVFHSFRHTFITYARESGMGDDVRRAITGHESGDVHAKYGEFTMGARFDAMRRYCVPGVTVAPLA